MRMHYLGLGLGLILVAGAAVTTSVAHADEVGPIPDPGINDALVASQLLFPQNYQMPDPGIPPEQGTPSPYELAPAVPGSFARVDALQGVHAILHAAIGQMPPEQLGTPLPGTQPPPGTALPAGPEQFLPGG